MAVADQVVLIGEPDQATRALYERALGAAFEVLVAPDQDAVLHLLQTRRLAALVLEPAIFVLGGWEQVVTVSELCAAAHVPLVICSTQDERRRGIELGAAAYLVKPTLPAALLEAVRAVIRAAEMRGSTATKATKAPKEGKAER
jgi:DNA-binding response OmpR family regulator